MKLTIKKLQAEIIKLKYELLDVEKENISLQENLNDISDTHSNVMNEKCWPDERHCTCVPFLRTEIDKLKLERENLQLTIRSLKDRINDN